MVTFANHMIKNDTFCTASAHSFRATVHFCISPTFIVQLPPIARDGDFRLAFAILAQIPLFFPTDLFLEDEIRILDLSRALQIVLLLPLLWEIKSQIFGKRAAEGSGSRTALDVQNGEVLFLLCSLLRSSNVDTRGAKVEGRRVWWVSSSHTFLWHKPQTAPTLHTIVNRYQEALLFFLLSLLLHCPLSLRRLPKQSRVAAVRWHRPTSCTPTSNLQSTTEEAPVSLWAARSFPADPIQSNPVRVNCLTLPLWWSRWDVASAWHHLLWSEDQATPK